MAEQLMLSGGIDDAQLCIYMLMKLACMSGSHYHLIQVCSYISIIIKYS